MPGTWLIAAYSVDQRSLSVLSLINIEQDANCCVQLCTSCGACQTF